MHLASGGTTLHNKTVEMDYSLCVWTERCPLGGCNGTLLEESHAPDCMTLLRAAKCVFSRREHFTQDTPAGIRSVFLYPCLSVYPSLSLSLIQTCPCTHTLLSSPSLALALHFFPPSTQWHPAVGRDITEKQSIGRREIVRRREGGLRKIKGGTLWKKRYRDCEGKRERFREGVRRAGAYKKIESEQEVEWVRSK